MLRLGLDARGEIANTVGIDNGRERLPRQPARPSSTGSTSPTTASRSTYLGQAIIDPNGEILTEFWNRSIKHVDSLDGTAPGPGPTSTPLLVRTRRAS